MAMVSRNSNGNKWRDRGISPERTKVWTEPNSSKVKNERRRVPVVYYLCRDGQLEHPHFMEVPLSENDGLHLKDVINRLNSLRGKGMASLYSWSSKRSYKNGFVWHDLSENDFIYPAHGQEYVLKGSELHDTSSAASFSSQETVSSSGEKLPGENNQRSSEDFPVVSRRRNQSWSSLDLHEYKVYKSESGNEFTGKAADASTQTDDKRRRQRKISIREEDDEEELTAELTQQNFSELNREEISPPPSSSSPETLETLIQADGSVIGINGSDIQAADMHPSGRIKASTVLMQLISCGSFSVKDYAASPEATKDHHQSFSIMSHYRSRLPRAPPSQELKEQESPMENPSFGRIQLEDKEYFSGSLIETKKNDFSALKRSSSYNADRSSKMELKEGEIEGVRAKCMPRRPKIPTRNTGTSTMDASKISTTVEGSK